LSIHDQGVGIPAENISKIFEPYFTTKSKGTGLGLAVVYSVIAKHEGHIDVESEVGKGTTFHILLPATSEGGACRNEGKESIIRGEGRVLLMDDEEFILDITGEVLRTLGYDVELARDGEEAVSMYRNALADGRGYDAVIMDLTIPGGMGGKEAIKELLKIDPQVKAIVSSGYSSDATMADHRKFGFSGVIPKPYKIEDLSRIMNEIIRSG
jgi:CheY-like chemotaxis protein